MQKMRSLLYIVPLWLACAAKPQTASTIAPVQPAATGIDDSAIDTTVKPCENFYQYACGKWIERTTIPDDRASWMRGFSEIDERNQTALRQILEKLATEQDTSAAPIRKKLGDFYGACMDEANIEKSALTEIKNELAAIDRIKNLNELARKTAAVHLDSGNAFFEFDSQQDFKDSSLMIGVVDQGGLGLPDRDYYLEAKFADKLAAYQKHIATMFTLVGITNDAAAKAAKKIVSIEMNLATASMSKEERREPEKVYHRLERTGLVKLAAHFPWQEYFAALGIPAVQQINVAVPNFFAKLDTAIGTVSLADWKIYLKWHVLHAAAPTLNRAIVEENFSFYGHTLQGTEKILPRWKRCVDATDDLIGEGLGQLFVAQYFAGGSKELTYNMVQFIETAMGINLTSLSWMDEATRAEAQQKLKSIGNKIGHPDRWRSYDTLVVARKSFYENFRHAATFEGNRHLKKIGQPVDRTEWLMSPPTVNAYYDPSMNEMVFPAGILQPPFFATSASQPVNFGAIGMVMGHELTHGFDDEGRQFDAHGNLRNWWSPSVNQAFEKRAQCVNEQFSSYTVNGDIHLNGKLTLGENIADLGGIKLAYAAYRAHKVAEPKSKFSGDQLFFLGAAQAWCGKRRPELTKMLATVDPHSPPEYRINGPLSNLPEFANAFSCKPNDKMVRSSRCEIW